MIVCSLINIKDKLHAFKSLGPYVQNNFPVEACQNRKCYDYLSYFLLFLPFCIWFALVIQCAPYYVHSVVSLCPVTRLKIFRTAKSIWKEMVKSGVAKRFLMQNLRLNSILLSTCCYLQPLYYHQMWRMITIHHAKNINELNVFSFGQSRAQTVHGRWTNIS